MYERICTKAQEYNVTHRVVVDYLRDKEWTNAASHIHSGPQIHGGPKGQPFTHRRKTCPFTKQCLCVFFDILEWHFFQYLSLMVMNHLIKMETFFKGLFWRWGKWLAARRESRSFTVACSATHEPFIQLPFFFSSFFFNRNSKSAYTKKFNFTNWHKMAIKIKADSSITLPRFSPLFRYSVLLRVLLFQIARFLLFPLLNFLLLVVIRLLKQRAHTLLNSNKQMTTGRRGKRSILS